MRNKLGVEITKGRWAVAEVSNGRGGRVVEGRIVGIDRHGEKVTLQARTPTANDPGCEVVFINTIVQTIGPMTVGPDGTVTQNPTPRLDRYDQPSQREHVTPKGKRTKRPSERLKARRVKTHYAKTPGVWANPLVRVKVKSPAQRGKGEPSPRLVARRKTTQKAPEGFYANPAPKHYGSASAKEWVLIEVQKPSDKRFKRHATFEHAAEARMYARALHNAHPTWAIRVSDES